MVCNSSTWSRACQAIVFRAVHNRLRLCTVHDLGNCLTSSLNPAWTVAKKFKWISLIRRPIIIGYRGLGNCNYTTSCDFINWHIEQTTSRSCIMSLLGTGYWNSTFFLHLWYENKCDRLVPLLSFDSEAVSITVWPQCPLSTIWPHNTGMLKSGGPCSNNVLFLFNAFHLRFFPHSCRRDTYLLQVQTDILFQSDSHYETSHTTPNK